MKEPEKALTLLPLLFFVFLLGTGCHSSRLPGGESVRQLQGRFVQEGAFLISELNFTGWNTVLAVPEFLPPCPYWINGDTVVIELDKAFLYYRILGPHTLLALGGWAGTDTIRIAAEDTATPPPGPHLLNDADKEWLRQQRTFHYQTLARPFNPTSPELLRNCLDGHGRSCLTYGEGLIKEGQIEEGMNYVKRACDTGFYYGCFRAGETLEGLKEVEEAIAYYRKGCEKGHLASCLSVDFLEEEKE